METETINQYVRDRFKNSDNPQYFNQSACEKDFIAGANEYKKYVLSVLEENYKACKNLTEEDKNRSAQDIINETYEDLISIFK